MCSLNQFVTTARSADLAVARVPTGSSAVRPGDRQRCDGMAGCDRSTCSAPSCSRAPRIRSPASTAPVVARTGATIPGLHVVCVVLTDEFLAFSKSVGNDLSTPMPQYGFAGLHEGDNWCLCASRWQEAFEAGAAPKVRLKASHISARSSIRNSATCAPTPSPDLRRARRGGGAVRSIGTNGHRDLPARPVHRGSVAQAGAHRSPILRPCRSTSHRNVPGRPPSRVRTARDRPFLLPRLRSSCTTRRRRRCPQVPPPAPGLNRRTRAVGSHPLRR